MERDADFSMFSIESLNKKFIFYQQIFLYFDFNNIKLEVFAR